MNLPATLQYLFAYSQIHIPFLLPLALIYFFSGRVSNIAITILSCIVYYLVVLYAIVGKDDFLRLVSQINFINMTLVLSFALIYYIVNRDPKLGAFGLLTVPAYMLANVLAVNLSGSMWLMFD